MRDPKRIPLILDRLRKVWEAHPDLRLAQMIGNAASGDPYYIEDEPLMKAIGCAGGPMTDHPPREQTARQRFVEAMRDLESACPCADYDNKRRPTMCCAACYSVERHDPTCMDIIHPSVRQAAEAFADAECRWPEHTQNLGEHAQHDAIACRAALLKEIFGE